MTRTVFGLTADNSTTGYPDMDGWPSSRGGAHDAIDRYRNINATGRYAYPYEAYDDGFNIPYILFRFTDAFGGRITDSPIVSLKMPGSFNLTSFSDYSRTENIFAVSSDSGIYNNILDTGIQSKQQEITDSNTGDVQNMINKIAKVGISGAEAVRYSWQKSLGTLEGWGASAGLSNLNQYEFMNRQAVNPMAQLLYRGPQMRRYQLPFSMHAKNSTDSSQIQKIISIFRVASSPSVPDTSGINVGGVNIGAGNAFTFGYPHLTQFDVYFIDDNNTLKIIYRSKLCAIESIAADYGGQKMTFFADGRPTDIAMTIQLTEVTPRTLGDSITDSNNSEITLR